MEKRLSSRYSRQLHRRKLRGRLEPCTQNWRKYGAAMLSRKLRGCASDCPTPSGAATDAAAHGQADCIGLLLLAIVLQSGA